MAWLGSGRPIFLSGASTTFCLKKAQGDSCGTCESSYRGYDELVGLMAHHNLALSSPTARYILLVCFAYALFATIDPTPALTRQTHLAAACQAHL